MLEGAGEEAVVAIVLSHGMQTIGGGWQLLGEVLVRLGYSSGSTSVGKLRGALPEPVKSLVRSALRGRARSGLQRVAGSLPAPLQSPETRAVALLNSSVGKQRAATNKWITIHSQQPVQRKRVLLSGTSTGLS